MVTRRTILQAATVITASSALAGWPVGPARATTKLKAYTYLPTIARPGAAGLERMGKEIEAASDGDLSVQLNLGGSLAIKGSDITQAVGDGVVDLAGNGFFHGSVPVGGILRLPMLMTDYDQFFAARDIVMPEMEEAFRRQGVKVLGGYVYPPQVAWASSPITSLDDLAGKKMRVTSAEQGAFVEAFGGVPVTIPSAEVTSALQRGVVDGVFTASIGGGAAWKDLLTHTYRLGISYFDSVIIMNADVYDSLSAEQQGIVSRLGREIGEAITVQMMEEEPAMTKTLAEGGIVVTEADPADVARANKAMAPFWDKWAENKDDTIKSTLARVRKSLSD